LSVSVKKLLEREEGGAGQERGTGINTLLPIELREPVAVKEGTHLEKKAEQRNYQGNFGNDA